MTFNDKSLLLLLLTRNCESYHTLKINKSYGNYEILLLVFFLIKLIQPRDMVGTWWSGGDLFREEGIGAVALGHGGALIERLISLGRREWVLLGYGGALIERFWREWVLLGHDK